MKKIAILLIAALLSGALFSCDAPEPSAPPQHSDEAEGSPDPGTATETEDEAEGSSDPGTATETGDEAEDSFDPGTATETGDENEGSPDPGTATETGDEHDPGSGTAERNSDPETETPPSSPTGDANESQSELKYIYLTTYKQKDVYLILKIIPDTGNKYVGAIVSNKTNKIQYGLMVNGSVKAEPTALDYEIITVNDEKGDPAELFIAFTSGDKTSIYTLGGVHKGDFLGFRKLTSGVRPSSVYYRFYEYEDKEPFVDSCFGLLDAHMNVVVQPEYARLDYVGFGIIKADCLTFRLEMKTDDGYVKYAGFIDMDGNFSYEGPYEEFEPLSYAVKIKEFGKEAYYVAGGEILKKAY